MALTIHNDSHMDHGVSTDIINYVLELYKDKDAFFLETIDVPAEFGTVPCGLYGPLMGDEEITDDMVEMVTRGERPFPSRMIDRPMRQVDKLTVIAGPYEDQACVVYTMFGGPVAPKEPSPDLNEDEMVSSKEFWSKHALSSQG